MRQRTLALIAATGLLVAGLLTLTHAYAAVQGVNLFAQLDLLVDVRHELVTSYVEEPDTTRMIESAVHGMIEALDDPYTTYLPPSDWERFERLTAGEFSGIGAEIDVDNRQLKIVTPLEDSPAWKAGVMAGDIITHIEGEPVSEIFQGQSTRVQMLNTAVDRLTGEAGTPVRITVQHEGGESEELTITRDVIQIQTVRGIRRNAAQHYEYLIDESNRIGYVRLSQFNEHTAEDLAEALDELLALDVRGLILDVRYNPGGLLTSAVQVSDMFLEEDQTIVSVRGRSVAPQQFKATGRAKLADRPIVVLANEASASASEIVAGALKENDRALFVGTRTFGKGSVQNVKMLGDQASPLGALKFTTAYYYGPAGRLIHRKEDSEVWGIDPSPGCYVPMTPDQRIEMLETRRDADVLRPDNGRDRTPITPHWIEQTLKDPQLAAALRAMTGRLETGQWPRVGRDDVETLVHEGRLANLRKERELVQATLDRIDEQIARLESEPADDSGEQPTDAEAAAEAEEAIEAEEAVLEPAP